MIKAEYKGISDEILGWELRSGKVYPISTYCEKGAAYCEGYEAGAPVP